MHADAMGERVRALAADRLALARGHGREECVERIVTGILPMELLVGALEIATPPEQVPFRLGEEGDIHGRRIRAPADVDERIAKGSAQRFGVRPRQRQQAPAGRRREGHGNLKLGIIPPAGALVGLSPAVVEDIFATGVGFDVAGDGTEQVVALILGEQVQGLPTDPRPDRARDLQCMQEGMRQERVVGRGLAAGLMGRRLRSSRIGAGVPCLGRNVADGIRHP